MVRSQLASTAGRLSVDNALPIVEALLRRNEDAEDAHIPLLLWWAIERLAIESMAEVEARFVTAESWKQPMVRELVARSLDAPFRCRGIGIQP